MKLHTRKIQKNSRIGYGIWNKGLLVLALAAMVLLSGCVQQDEATISPTTPQGVSTPAPAAASGASGLYVTKEDVGGLELKTFGFYAASQSVEYNITTRATLETYRETLPLGKRNVGQISVWQNKAGKLISVNIDKYDSKAGMDTMIAGLFKSCDLHIKSGEWKKSGDTIKADCGSPNIGDNSFYSYTIGKKNPDLKQVLMYYSKGNYYVSLMVYDLEDESYAEAIELAGKINKKLS